ncbi:hypothetical protein BV25DRAFT_789282 [Artomyces pyxidatus]|uniref:Uncharacterized protein n=1 Tax=Artomyces pyxidatus TaxID=48021 RepID=A0ACB8SYQ8_9AGAM|nr:hypothetical protein BV25DRAFT_789282 [Artomyces pyxidatus]
MMAVRYFVSAYFFFCIQWTPRVDRWRVNELISCCEERRQVSLSVTILTGALASVNWQAIQCSRQDILLADILPDTVQSTRVRFSTSGCPHEHPRFTRVS